MGWGGGDLWHLPCELEAVVEGTALPGPVDLPRNMVAPDLCEKLLTPVCASSDCVAR